MTTPGNMPSSQPEAPAHHAKKRNRKHTPPDAHLRFERLISDLSARFVNIAPDQVDGEIVDALERVLEHFQVDRCGLLGLSSDRSRVHVTHAAYAEGIERVSGDIDLATLFPWTYERLVLQGLPVNIASIEDLSEKAVQDSASCTAMGIRSFLDIPLFFEGRVSSIIVINAVRRQRSWPEEYIPRLRLLGDIFISALERKRSEQALRESEASLLLATDSGGMGLWSMDVSTSRVWVTAKTLELFGFSPEEEITYRSFDQKIHPEDRGQVREAVQQALRTGAELRVEYRISCPDGSLRWITARGRPQYDASGNVKRLMGASVDITERKQMQEQILTASDEWHRTFNTIQDMIMIMDREFRIIQVNDSAVKFFGLPKKRIIGTPCFTLMHGTESPIEGCPYKKMMDTKQHEETEVYDEKRNRWFHVVVDPLLGEKEEVIGVVHTVKDITAHKLAETARMESTERYRAVVEAYDGLIYICSQDYRIEFMNQRLIERTGRDAAGELCYRALHDRDSVCPWCVNEKVFQGETVRWEVQSPKDHLWYYVVNTPIRHADGTISKQSMIMDITGRKRIEAALEESRAQIAAVMNSTKDFIWSVDPERFGLLMWNRAFSDYFFERRGIKLEVGMTPAELVPPDYVPLWHDLFSRALREGSIVAEYVVVAQTNTLHLSLNAMRRHGVVFGISVFGRDISELKRAEQELRQSEERFRQVAENVGDVIWQVDANGLYRYVSPAVEKVLGYTPDELIGKMHFYDLFAPEVREELKAAAFKVFAAQKSFRAFPNANMSKDGKTVHLETSGVPKLDEAGNLVGYRGSDTDVTERKQAEEALSRSEASLRSSQTDLRKLAGKLISAKEDELRRLSRELHDDLTQRLAVLAIEAGKLELQLNKMPHFPPEPLQKISQVKEQLIKVSEDVHRISRQLHPTILDDLGLVRAIESECAALMRRENLEISFRKEDVPGIIANDIALCLYRVVQESLRNVITHSGAKNCGIFLKGSDSLLCLTVSDNGVGFDPAEVRHKPGLGLSSMRERAQLVRGDFSIESRPGQGAVIRICVPLKGGGA